MAMRRSVLLGVCAVLIGAAGLIALVVANRPASPGPAAASTAGPTSVAVPTEPTKPTALALPSRTETAPASPTEQAAQPLGSVLDMAFVDAQHGWLLGTSGGATADRPVVRVTTDGGKTWQPTAAPPAQIAWYPPDFARNHTVRAVRFVDAENGWAFLPGLYSTHDGGTTWSDETSGNDAIVALETQGSSAWAIKRSCADLQEAASCTFTLIASTGSGRSWQPVRNQPSMPGLDVQLIRATADMGWLLTSGPEQVNPRPNTRLLRTNNGGNSWQALADPPCPEQATARFATLPSGRIWLLCGGQPGAGQQLKSLYVSPDGGATWQTVAGNPVTQPGVEHILPGSGYVAALLATSPQRLWMVLQRAGVFGSIDGGQSWQIAGPNIDWGDYSGVGPIVFSDETHGWFSTYNKVYRTTDGGATWEGTEVR